MPTYERLINYLSSIDEPVHTIDIAEVERLIGNDIQTLFFDLNDDAKLQNSLIDKGYLLTKVDLTSKSMSIKKMSLIDRAHAYIDRMYLGKANRVIKDVSNLPNIYSLAKEYLVQQTKRVWPTNIDDQEAKVEEYFTPNALPLSFESILEELASSLQTGQALPRVIKFLQRKDKLKEIFCDYDKDQLKNADVRTLQERCKNEFYHGNAGWNDTVAKRWEDYVEGMINGAVILSRFNTHEEFISAISNFSRLNKKQFSFDDYQGNKDSTSCARIINGHDDTRKWKIKGMGKELACNFLKELGLPDYVKPDVHIQDVFSALGLCSRDEYECLEVGKMLAKECGVNAYKFDRVIWLCCSGHYYRDYPKNLGGGAKKLKQPFINYLKTHIGGLN